MTRLCFPTDINDRCQLPSFAGTRLRSHAEINDRCQLPWSVGTRVVGKQSRVESAKMFATFKELWTLLPFPGPSATSSLPLVTPPIADWAPVPPAVPVAVSVASAAPSLARSAVSLPVARPTGCKEFSDPSPVWFLDPVPSRWPSDARPVGRLMPGLSAV